MNKKRKNLSSSDVLLWSGVLLCLAFATLDLTATRVRARVWVCEHAWGKKRADDRGGRGIIPWWCGQKEPADKARQSKRGVGEGEGEGEEEGEVRRRFVATDAEPTSRAQQTESLRGREKQAQKISLFFVFLNYLQMNNLYGSKFELRYSPKIKTQRIFLFTFILFRFVFLFFLFVFVSIHRYEHLSKLSHNLITLMQNGNCSIALAIGLY